MAETGFNKTELGKIILAACFINDLGTVLALGIVFAHYDAWLALFGAVTAISLWLLPRFARWFFKSVGRRVSEPETKPGRLWHRLRRKAASSKYMWSPAIRFRRLPNSLSGGGFDLLVVGYMGHSALYNRLIGSTAERLVEHAPSAVLVIK